MRCNSGEAKILIQRHLRSSPSNSFHRVWTDFKNGFCDSSGNLWVGNEKLYQATSVQSPQRRRLVVELIDTDDNVSAQLN